MRAGFLNQLVVSPLPDGRRWQLQCNLFWRWRDGSQEVVPVGTVTDFASVPDLAWLFGVVAGVAHGLGWAWLFWPALGVILMAHRLQDDERIDGPATFHDQDYKLRTKPRWLADWHLVVRMRVNRVARWKCFLYWINLRLFGWIVWYRLGPKLKAWYER